jgi:hypothetical protein
MAAVLMGFAARADVAKSPVMAAAETRPEYFRKLRRVVGKRFMVLSLCGCH